MRRGALGSCLRPPLQKKNEREGFLVSVPTLLVSSLPAEGLIAPLSTCPKILGPPGDLLMPPECCQGPPLFPSLTIRAVGCLGARVRLQAEKSSGTLGGV